MLEVTELARELHFRARLFVGRVQLGRWQITVEPKISAVPLLNPQSITQDRADAATGLCNNPS